MFVIQPELLKAVNQDRLHESEQARLAALPQKETDSTRIVFPRRVLAWSKGQIGTLRTWMRRDSLVNTVRQTNEQDQCVCLA